MSSNGYLFQAFAGMFLFFLTLSTAKGQEERFFRIYLVDKGTPDRVLLPSDPWYSRATAHLTERALKRRAKVLALDSLVSTADLPLYEEYLEEITELGAKVIQTSRWLNTAMIKTDSATFQQVQTLPFVRKSMVVRTRKATPVSKLPPPLDLHKANTTPIGSNACVTTMYGLADRQNRAIGIDAAQSLGFAGEGVLIGVLDGGFGWRSHNALQHARVIAEYDFVNHDEITSDEPEQTPSENHGTLVMSIIAGWLEGEFIGGAPRAEFALAKTEDIASEHHVEEDNFVAGLEWLESLGVDVTNTSLGYTTFDEPENDHTYEELDGKTTHASQGVNYATRLGVICVIAAGNDFNSYRYVGVPAEADSAFAVAALDTAGNIANFSSRGFGDRTRIKPDIAAPGVFVYGAQAGTKDGFVAQQGTSLASPLATSAIALLLSARPDLRPWEVRELLFETSANAANPDTAVGYGQLDVNKAFARLSLNQPLTGEPKLRTKNNALSLITWIVGDEPRTITEWKETTTGRSMTLTLRNLRTNQQVVQEHLQPVNGLAGWIIPTGMEQLALLPGDSVEVQIVLGKDGALLRRTILRVTEDVALPASTLCYDPPLPVTALATARPNPFNEAARIEFTLDATAMISLDVFNVRGENVRRLLASQEKDPGFYSILLNPYDLPGGAYYYRLTVNDAVYSEQMIYLP